MTPDKDKDLKDKSSASAGDKTAQAPAPGNSAPAPGSKPSPAPGGKTAAKPFSEEDFKQRIEQVKVTRWIRFSLVALVWMLFCIWLGNLWLLIVLPLLFDIYITGYIPFSWWKHSPHKIVRTLMGWVDAIVYALILVYFLFAFVGQQYKIPSSSLEKTLLVGDYLWVNKAVYGPRVPQTPIHFPLAQHTFPWGGKSYSDLIQLEYHRLPGLRNVERYDIVVFNAPMEDSVLTKRTDRDPDYYHLVQMLESDPQAGITDGRRFIKEHPEMFGELIRRPVDRRENFVKRVVGLPGERFKIVNDIIYINGKPLKEPENVQHNYIVPVNAPISPEEWESIGVSAADIPMLTESPLFENKIYELPLTSDMAAATARLPQVAGKIERVSSYGEHVAGIFPLSDRIGWTQENMGEFWIPKQGYTLHLTANNLPIYRRAIETYEGNKVDVTPDGKIYINGKQTEYYTFKLDYYWMMGDNRDNSADSRYWGFVPEDHVIGTPWRVLISFDSDKPLFKGGIRWNRMLHEANPDK